MYRAKTLQGKEVFGYHCVIGGKHYMILEDAEIWDCSEIGLGGMIDGFVEIDPSTLARDTTVKDKNGRTIWGSFPVDGVMSKGGDNIAYSHSRTQHRKGRVFYKDAKWLIDCYWVKEEPMSKYGATYEREVEKGSRIELFHNSLCNLEIIGPACDVGDKK